MKGNIVVAGLLEGNADFFWSRQSVPFAGHAPDMGQVADGHVECPLGALADLATYTTEFPKIGTHGLELVVRSGLSQARNFACRSVVAEYLFNLLDPLSDSLLDGSRTFGRGKISDLELYPHGGEGEVLSCPGLPIFLISVDLARQQQPGGTENAEISAKRVHG